MPQTQSTQEKNPIVGNMQKNGMSTKDILKSLAAPMLKELGMTKDSKGASIIIATDMVNAQTDAKVKNNIQRSDDTLDKIGKLGELISGISEKKPKAMSEGIINDFNAQVNKSNGISVELWDLTQQVKSSMQDTKVTHTELVSMSNNGTISPDQLVQKLREHHEKNKQTNMTDPNSNMKQSDSLAKQQTAIEKPVEKMEANVMQIMSQRGLTKESLKTAAPEAPEAEAQEGPKKGSGGGMGAGRSGGGR